MTLWGVCAKQTIPLSVLARNPNKGLSWRSPTRPEVGAGPREARGAVGKGTQEGELAKGDVQRQSTTEGRGERSALSGLSRECQSQQKSERRLLKPDELHRVQANQREKICLVSFPGHPSVFLPFCRDAVGVFYSPSRLGYLTNGFTTRDIRKCVLSSGT